jgi:hypothetical protein
MLSVHEPQPDSPFVVEFDVSTAFMGLAIGAQGANISNARSLDGITVHNSFIKFYFNLIKGDQIGRIHS